MHKYLMATVALAASLPLTSGCFPAEDSCNIKTGGLYLQLETIEEDGAVEAQAIFWVGDRPGGTYLELGDCGDEISVNGAVMSASPGYDNPEVYVANIDVAESYEFTLSRPDEDPYVSTVSNTRQAVTVTGPIDASISRAEGFDVTWDDNDGGEAEVSIDGDCFFSYSETVLDNGSHTVAADSLSATDSDAAETCSGTIFVERSTSGTMASGLAGTVDALVRDRTVFSSTP